MQRFSRKRQAILDCLRSTREHPSAEWVFSQLKPVFPDLSLATVYRNLGQLKEAGEIRSVGTVQGLERFDGFTAPHSHAVCTRCGRVTDIADLPLKKEIEAVEKQLGFTVECAGLQFSGICADCAKKNGK